MVLALDHEAERAVVLGDQRLAWADVRDAARTAELGDGRWRAVMPPPPPASAGSAAAPASNAPTAGTIIHRSGDGRFIRVPSVSLVGRSTNRLASKQPKQTVCVNADFAVAGSRSVSVGRRLAHRDGQLVEVGVGPTRRGKTDRVQAGADGREHRLAPAGGRAGGLRGQRIGVSLAGAQPSRARVGTGKWATCRGA